MQLAAGIIDCAFENCENAPILNLRSQVPDLRALSVFARFDTLKSVALESFSPERFSAK
jgi:hypothetical protein